MTRLLILVEGQSEEIFAKQTLTPYLAERDVYLERPIVLWTKRIFSGGGHRGGALSWSQIQKNLLPLLKDSDAWVTTLLDFYGLPNDVPGYKVAYTLERPRNRVIELQKNLFDEFNHPRFIPFFALHELEAWIFCDPETVSIHFDQASLAVDMQEAVVQAGGPELINHGKATHPKARLKSMVPEYKETSDGSTLLRKIGIPTIRASCPHFSAWLSQLEALAK